MQISILIFTAAIVSAAPVANDNGGGWEIPDDMKALPEDASGFAPAGKIPLRPGHATKTHSCDKVRSVPAELRSGEHMRPNGLADFYQKYTEAYGIPIISSSKVNDDALKRACYVIRFLLADNAKARETYYLVGGRVGIIGKDELTTDMPEYSHYEPWINDRARGMGGNGYTNPFSSGAEENALCLPGDHWGGDDIVLHEFLHSLYAMGLNMGVAGMKQKIVNTFHKARETKQWGRLYAMMNPAEYFAETGQSYLNSHVSVGPPPDRMHNHISTRELLKGFDRPAYELHRSVFTCNNEYLKGCEAGQTSAERRAAENAQVLRMDCS